jgi:hypothetical protein
VTVLTHHRAALIGVFTIAAMFAGTAWSVAGPLSNPDHGCTYSPKAKSDVFILSIAHGRTPPDISTSGISGFSRWTLTGAVSRVSTSMVDGTMCDETAGWPLL